MEVSDQPHGMAALPLGKETLSVHKIKIYIIELIFETFFDTVNLSVDTVK
jgi:hypothetical protein